MNEVEPLLPLAGLSAARRPIHDANLDSLAHSRLVIALAGLGTLRIDTAARLVLMDAAAAVQHGVPGSADREVALEAWLLLISKDDQMRMHTLIESALMADGTRGLTVKLASLSAAAQKTVEFLFRTDSDTADVVGVCRDVTTAQNMEEVRRQRLAAERASTAKSTFMSQVSHELRTPLNAILGFAQLMSIDVEQQLSGRQQERLQIIHRSGLRLLSLVDQLLQIGKIEQGKLDLHPRAVNVYAIVRRCVDSMTPMAVEREVAIEIDIPDAEGASVRADESALEQVLANLLSNGIKYSGNGGRVALRYRAAEVGEICVSDTGPGLTASQIAHLFEPFNRLDAGSGSVQGTGLGLVITRRLVEAMGGSLHVWSQVGVGSRFQVTLPKARKTRAKGNHTIPLDMPPQWATGAQVRALYVEDDEVNIVLMDQLFSTQDEWSLSVATSGAAGIVDAVTQRPDVILLDLNLPDMDGFEVLKRLKLDRRTRDIPVVAVSANAMPSSLRRSRHLGFEDYWTKPLDLPATVGKLKALFLGYRQFRSEP